MSPSPQGCCIHFSHEIASWESERKRGEKKKHKKNLRNSLSGSTFCAIVFPGYGPRFLLLSSRCSPIYFSTSTPVYLYTVSGGRYSWSFVDKILLGRFFFLLSSFSLLPLGCRLIDYIQSRVTYTFSGVRPSSG